MTLFPVDRVELCTPLPKNEVAERLGYNTGSNGNKRFRGTIGHDSFTIKRVISYRNSFLPEIHGQITGTPSGTSIILTLRLIRAVRIFMSAWLTIAAAALAGILALSFFDGFPALAALVPLAMLGIGIAGVNIGFSAESERAIDDLSTILEAHVRN